MVRSIPCSVCPICNKEIVTTKKNIKYHQACWKKSRAVSRAAERKLIGRGPGSKLVVKLLNQCGEAIRAGRIPPMS